MQSSGMAVGAESRELTWNRGREGCIFSKPISSDALTPSRLNLLNAPNSAPKWGPSVQMSETMGGIFHSSYHMCVSIWDAKTQSQHWGSSTMLFFLSHGLSLAECGAHQLLE